MKKLCSCLLSLALLCALAAVPASAAYSDVPSGSALASEVEKAVGYGLMNGYSAGTFGYADPMTRAQFVTVLDRMLLPQDSDTTLVGHITPEMQVEYDAVRAYYSSIDAAAEYGWVDTDEPFRPTDPITRGEMSEILVRALGLGGAAAIAEKNADLPFTDVTAGKGYISVAYDIGMTKGTNATTFGPNETATRAQAAAMLVRIYEKLRQDTGFLHGFYAISSYSQLSLMNSMDAVSAGWSRMTWDGTTALLATTTADGNEYAVPQGYEEVVAQAENNGVKLHLNVFMEGEDLKALLSSADGRAQAVEQILGELTVSYKTVGRNPYSGVTIDFEGLRSADAAAFTAFLTDLAQQVRALDKSLYVCVSPALTTGSYYDGYELGKIAALADKVILMAYDYEDRSMAAGASALTAAPTSPMDQVYWSLKTAVDQVIAAGQSADKLVLGISCKNVAWKVSSTTDLTLAAAAPFYISNDTLAQRLGQSGTVRGRSNTFRCPYAVYTTEDGSTCFVWYDDAESVQARIDTAKLLGITGVSVWRLGTVPAYGNWSWTEALN
ncbi:glycosyl hydrolase family 18 protein [Dysosmobacter sp.]|uniref:glycosyl hydrolase family 18 protein n=1 Tax=Dysosmobacter sp. TaxID=2591382 RepID=UPI002D7F47C8|nr:glycosyl hydrolase family 18 protein [Dysosmobacter sp.]MCI6055236.1 glycosyl hydrolase family 18 protein [Dysosmobacter sp.]